MREPIDMELPLKTGQRCYLEGNKDQVFVIKKISRYQIQLRREFNSEAILILYNKEEDQILPIADIENNIKNLLREIKEGE